MNTKIVMSPIIKYLCSYQRTITVYDDGSIIFKKTFKNKSIDSLKIELITE